GRRGRRGPARLLEPTLMTVAAAYGLALVLAGAAGLFGIPLAALVLFSLSRYGYTVLRNAAQGRTHLSAPDMDSMNPFGELGATLHLAFFAGLGWLLADPPVSEGSALWPLLSAALVLVVLIFPASAALLGVTTSLNAAFDPRAIAELIRGFGARRYAGLIAAVLVAAVLIRLLHAFVPGVVALPLSIYAFLGAFFAVGLALHASRDVLEIPGEREPDDERSARLLREDWQVQLDGAYASIRSGLVEQGYRTLRALLTEA